MESPPPDIDTHPFRFGSIVSTPPFKTHVQIEDLRCAEALQGVKAEQRITAPTLESLVCPILEIPVEITLEIFVHHIHGLSVAHHDDLPLVNLATAKSAGPLFLSHVCRAWRSISIYTPSLWCCVHAPSSQKKPSDWRKLLECWLPRAGNRPLYLDLAGKADPRQTALLFPAIAPYSSRWRSFTCTLQTPSSFSIDSLEGHIPLLRELCICEGARNDEEAAVSDVSAFRDAPELRQLKLQYFPPSKILIPWRQLTHLTLYGQKVRHGIDVLHQTPNLEELSVDLYQCSASILNPYLRPQPVTLNRVHKLLIPNNLAWAMENLRYITLPNLITLNFRSESYVVGDAEALVALIVRSQCVVETVTIDCHYNSALLALLGMSGIRQLILPRVNWEPTELAQLFTLIATDPTFVPHMHSLHLPHCRTVIPYMELTHMLSTRCHARGSMPRLNSFRLIRSRGALDPMPDPTIAARLNALMKEGLDIRIKRLSKIKSWSEDSDDSD
ncbi:F-box domain-containing protein [Favolaschia claudopus]|uniref:F-box domain-containing protein n=1 Tax=Favolaschia claudopus TaxID=2862362 RepID=A0AAW0A720_9AGAR